MNFIYVYVLLSCKDGGWYTGCLKAFFERQNEHL